MSELPDRRCPRGLYWEIDALNDLRDKRAALKMPAVRYDPEPRPDGENLLAPLMALACGVFVVWLFLRAVGP